MSLSCINCIQTQTNTGKLHYTKLPPTALCGPTAFHAFDLISLARAVDIFLCFPTEALVAIVLVAGIAFDRRQYVLLLEVRNHLIAVLTKVRMACAATVDRARPSIVLLLSHQYSTINIEKRVKLMPPIFANVG